MRLGTMSLRSVLAVLIMCAVQIPCAGQTPSLLVRSASAVPGQTVDIAVDVSSVSPISGVSFTLVFDQSTPPGQPVPQASNALLGPMMPVGGAFIESTTAVPGRITVAMATSRPVQGSGTILLIPLKVPTNASPGTVYQLTLTNVDMIDANLRPLSPTVQGGTLTVLKPSTSPVASVTVIPSTAEMVVGTVFPFRAEAKDASGTVIPDAPIVWAVRPGADGGAGTITQDGVFTATAPGNAVVTAASGSIVGTANIRILSEAPSTSVTIGTAVGAAGTKVYVSVGLGDVKGVGGADLSITYSTSSPPGAPALVPGPAERGSIAEQAVVETNLNTPGVVRILVASAQGFDGPGQLVRIPFSIPAAAAPGTVYQIKLSAAALNDIQGRDIRITAQDGSITVRDTVGPIAAVVVIPNAVAVPMGTTVRFKATVLDASGNEIVSPTVKWSVEPGTGSGQVDAAGVFTPSAPGTVVVRATADSVSGTAQVVVEPVVPANHVRVGSATVTPGATVEIPVTISQSTFNGVDIVVDYSQVNPQNAPALVPADPPISTVGTLCFQALVDANLKTPGQIRIGVISGQSLNGPGTLVKLVFNVPANAPDGAVYSLRILSLEIVDAVGSTLPSTKADGAVTVAADKTPPAVLLTSPKPNSVVRGIVPVEGTATDDRGPVTRIELLIDGSSAPAATTNKSPFLFNLATAGLSDGSHTVVVRAVDSSGNFGQSNPVAIIVDNTPPSVSLSGLTEGQMVRNVITLKAVASDANGVTTAELRVDGSASPVATVTGEPFNFTVDTAKYADGRHSFEVTVYDKAGNSSKRSVSVVVDNTPPAVLIEGVSEGQLLRGVVPVSVKAEDTGGIASVDVTADGAVTLGRFTNPPFNLNLDTTRLADGVHTLDVLAVDSVGNTGMTSVSISVDNTAPSVKLKGLENGQYIRGSVPVSVDASDASGVSSVQVTVSGSPVGAPITKPPFNFTVNTVGLSDGGYTVEASAADNAGNVGRTSVVVNVDNTAPTASITFPTPLQEVSGSLTVKGTAADASPQSFGSYLLEYGVGDNPSSFTPVGDAKTTPVTSGDLGTLDLKPLAPGVYTLRLTVNDKAGNTAVALVAFKVAAAPQVLPGDVNGDGKVSVADATVALRIAVGMEKPTPAQLEAGDLDKNGKIEVREVTRILRYAVKLSPQL